jgi:hypothetical protein
MDANQQENVLQADSKENCSRYKITGFGFGQPTDAIENYKKRKEKQRKKLYNLQHKQQSYHCKEIIKKLF